MKLTKKQKEISKNEDLSKSYKIAEAVAFIEKIC